MLIFFQYLLNCFEEKGQVGGVGSLKNDPFPSRVAKFERTSRGISTACKAIANAVKRSQLTGLTGLEGGGPPSLQMLR